MKRFHSFFLVAYRYIIIVCVLVLVFFVIQKLNSTDEEKKVEYKTDESGKLKPVAVGGGLAFKGDLIIRVSATGLARAKSEIDIVPEVSGRITTMFVKEGDYVKKGDPLFKIDDARYQLSFADAEDKVRSAQAKFVDLLFTKHKLPQLAASDSTETKLWYEDENEAMYRHSKELYNEGQLSAEELDAATLNYNTAKEFASQDREDRVIVRSGLSQARNLAKRAKLDLEATIVRAPFSGLIGDQKICAGMHVSPGKVCFKLVDLSTIMLEVGCLESEIKDITIHRNAEVTFPGFANEVFKGWVVSVNPLVDPQTKTCRVMVAIANPENRIKAGMFAFVKLEAAILKERLLVPREAILVRMERDLLFISRKGKAIWSYVDLGRSNEEYYEILKSTYSLAPGDTVLTENHYTIYHDALVKTKIN